MLLHGAAEILFAKLPVSTLKGRNACDLAINQTFARCHAIFRTEIGNGEAVDQSFQYIVEAAAVDIGF